MPLLIAFAGLPGTGKTTLARALARERQAVYLRIDTIEQAIRDAGVLAGEVGPAGYIVAYALAEANLRQGLDVVADSVNPIPITRDAWRDIALRAGARLAEVEITCSDAAEHRARIETRALDVPGLIGPDWQAVLSRDYAPWTRPRIQINTAGRSEAEALAELAAAI
jgi:predicted kinase